MTLVFAALGLLVLGLCAELAARWWLRHHTRYAVWPPNMRLDIRQDPGLFPELEPQVRFEVNADGERGGEAPVDDGLYRVLAVGGSSVECYALDQPTGWPAKLEALLNRPDARARLAAKRVHVGNIGHSGVGAAELETILARVLPQYDRGALDTILIMVSASTAYHWLEAGAPAGSEPPVVPEDALFAQHPAQSFGWHPRATALRELVRRLRQAWLRPVEIKKNVGAWLVTGRKMRAEARDLRSTIPDPSVVLDHFERHFRGALRLASAHARRVVIVRQPWFEKQYTAAEQARFWHGGIGKPWKEKVSVYFSLDVINRILDLIDGRVVRVAEKLGLQHVNLRPVLNQGLRHYYDHDHFTPEGAACAARAVAAALTEDNTVTKKVTPRVTQARIPLAAR